MRTLTAAESAALDAAVRQNGIKVEIQNGDGTWIDYSDRLIGGGFSRSENQSITSVAIELRRDKSPVTANSLAPFMEGSTLNRLDDGVTYSPAIDGGRGLRISIATVAAGTTPAPADHHLVFRGITDEADSGKNPLTVEAHDLGSHLKERFIEQETTYEQAAMEDMIQSIFSDWTGGITLYSINGTAATPFDPADAPGYTVNETTFDGISVWNAAERIAQLNGWTMRFRWNESVGDFVATLMEPDRDRETDPAAPGFSADWTHRPSRYYVVPRLATGKRGVRNAIGGHYHDEDGVKHEVATITDSFSISKYDRQFFGLREGTDSPINTLPEFQTMQGKALTDLKDPAIDQEIELPLFWPVEIGDLYLFKANGVHYDTDQAWTVAGYRHNLTRERTIITVRGKASGGYRNWLERPTRPGEEPPVGATNPAYQLHNIRWDPTGDTETHKMVRFDAGSAVEEVWGAARAYPGEQVTDAMQDAVRAAAEWVADGSGHIMVPNADEGEVAVGWLQPVVFQNGLARDLGGQFFYYTADYAFIIPSDPRFTESADGLTSTVRLGVIDPRGVVTGATLYLKSKAPGGAETSMAMAVDATTGEFVHTFALDQKHVQLVRINLTRDDGGPTISLGPYTVDAGKVAQVTDVRFAPDGEGGAVFEAEFDTDTDPTHVTGGARYRIDGGAWSNLNAGGFEAAWVVAQSETAAINVEVQAVNAAGEWGPIFGPVAVPRWIEPPAATVEVTENAAGSQATVRVKFDDPLGVVTGVSAHVYGVGVDTTTALTASGGWWSHTFDLLRKHNLLVEFIVTRSNGPNFTLGPFTTDADKIPEVTAGPSVEYDQEGTGYVSIEYDVDGIEYRYRVETAAGIEVLAWSTYAALTNYAATFPVAQDSDTELVVQIQARSSGGVVSEISDTGLEQWVPDNPHFKITTSENAAGSQGTIYLEPTDPHGVVDTVTVHKFIGGTETVVPAANVTWDAVAGRWSYTFDLAPKPHNTLIWVEVQRLDTMPNYWLPIQTFDSDKEAEIESLSVAYDGSGGAVVTVGVDTDTASIEYSDDAGATWTADTVTNGEAVFPITQTGSVQTILVRGINGAGQAGASKSIDVEARILAEPALTQARLTVTDNGTDIVYEFAYWVNEAVTDAGYDVRILLYEAPVDANGVVGPYEQRIELWRGSPQSDSGVTYTRTDSGRGNGIDDTKHYGVFYFLRDNATNDMLGIIETFPFPAVL